MGKKNSFMRYMLLFAVFLTGCAEDEPWGGEYWDKALKSCAVAHGWEDLNLREQVQPAGYVDPHVGAGRRAGEHWKVKVNPWFARAFLHTFPEQWEIDMRQMRDESIRGMDSSGVLMAEEYRRECIVEKGTYRVLAKRNVQIRVKK